MSRCFPYPPPGCALSRASKYALVESVKFQNEKVKSKEQKEKREKKEKRKEKKNAKKQNLDKSLVQNQLGEKICADLRGKSLSKGSKAEIEQQLEQSSLTEEHGKPARLRAPSTSSDSTENSIKRKRHPSPIDVTRGHGKIIRIRLPLKRQIQSDALGSEHQPCSTSGRTSEPSQNEGVGIGSRNGREQICLTSQPVETFVARGTPSPPMIDTFFTPMQRAEIEYMDLINSVVPPQQQDASLDADDLDWLFKNKNLVSCAERRRVSGNDGLSCSSSSGLWPRVQYLQEVDMYALPFTVPF